MWLPNKIKPSAERSLRSVKQEFKNQSLFLNSIFPTNCIILKLPWFLEDQGLGREQECRDFYETFGNHFCRIYSKCKVTAWDFTHYLVSINSSSISISLALNIKSLSLSFLTLSLSEISLAEWGWTTMQSKCWWLISFFSIGLLWRSLWNSY